MIGSLGFLILLMTLAVAIYSAVAATYGGINRQTRWVESGRRAMTLSFPLLTLVALAIIHQLVTGAYELAYVASVTSEAMPAYLKVTALWGGQQGSLVFWSWLMSAFAAAVSLRSWDRDQDLLPWVTAASMITLAFFLVLIVFFENPFARLWQTAAGETVAAILPPAGAVAFTPADGSGLNPLLRHPGMIIHPPMLYLGFVGFVVPYSFAMAALISGRDDPRWIRLTRRWALVAWLFLSLGLILGGRWAYDVLGWGGYWGWDPVEIAAFMPWLTGTAFLHSVMIQEKRGMLKHWNMVLIILTYALVIFGTFLTRSGVLSSVHSFAQSAIGPMFFAFIAITFLVSVGLLIWRWRELSSDNELHSWFSRESLFLLNNLLFVGILVVCFWGVMFPLISELVTGQKVTVGPPFYERATAPLWAGLLLLMGIAPLSAYGRSSWQMLGRSIWRPLALALLTPVALLASGIRAPGALLGAFLVTVVVLITVYEFWRGALARRRRHGEGLAAALANLAARNRRRYGGYVIHLGVVVMAIGIIGIEMYQSETQSTLAQGESLTIGAYEVVYESLAEFPMPDDRLVTRAVVTVYRDDRYVGELFPRRDFYLSTQQPMTIPGVRSTLEDDLYVLLVGWEPIEAGGATFKVYRNPLVNFVWFGGLVFILGTAVAAWPERTPVQQLSLARRRRAAVVGA